MRNVRPRIFRNHSGLRGAGGGLRPAQAAFATILDRAVPRTPETRSEMAARSAPSRFALERSEAESRPAAQASPEAGERSAALELLRRAEALSIPCERLLREEIQAEETLRRHAGASEPMPLATALSLLPTSFLKSWRVRDQIQSLSCEARGAAFRNAVRELRLAFRALIGQAGPFRDTFAGHLWLAHQRVLLLQRVCRAARRSTGPAPERMASICARTRCSFDDAAWALCLEGSPRAGHRLDAAIRKARDEGFHIPRAVTEARAFAKLRRVVGGSTRGPRRGAAMRSRDLPARVGLPSDAV